MLSRLKTQARFASVMRVVIFCTALCMKAARSELCCCSMLEELGEKSDAIH